MLAALPDFGNRANKNGEPCRNAGKAAGIYFASGGNQDSVISVPLPLLRRPVR
jgi:hypothetical protein